MTRDYVSRLIVTCFAVFSEKRCYLCKWDKELFESMRNMAVRNSPAFSYPLPVLVRVLSNLLIVK